jgi:hypothetical protein
MSARSQISLSTCMRRKTLSFEETNVQTGHFNHLYSSVNNSTVMLDIVHRLRLFIFMNLRELTVLLTSGDWLSF